MKRDHKNLYLKLQRQAILVLQISRDLNDATAEWLASMLVVYSEEQVSAILSDWPIAKERPLRPSPGDTALKG